MIPLGEIAVNEFVRRRDTARRKVGQGQGDLAQAEAALRPWLAIACLAGGALPELDPLLAERAPSAGMTQGEARWLIAEDICPRSQWIVALANARDHAVCAAHDDATLDRARGLLRLSRHFEHDINGRQPLHPFRDRPRPAQQVAA